MQNSTENPDTKAESHSASHPANKAQLQLPVRSSRDSRLSRRPLLNWINPYVGLVEKEFSEWVLTEKDAPEAKGQWRTKVFGEGSQDRPLDLEIGVGNGYFFEHYTHEHPDRLVLGIEFKFKPLIQTIRRAVRAGSCNMRAIRYDASQIQDLFAVNELDHVFIFFPDPWPKKRHHKNRLITAAFLNELYEMQKPGSLVEIKTDNVEYFDWILERIPLSPYKIEIKTRDLHGSEWAHQNFMTHFEKLWTSKGLKTHYLRLRRP